MRAPIDIAEYTSLSSLNLGQITPQKRKINMRKKFLRTLRVKSGMRVCLPLVMKMAIVLLSLTPQKTYSACAVNTVTAVDGGGGTIALPAPGANILYACCQGSSGADCQVYCEDLDCAITALCLCTTATPSYPIYRSCPTSMTPYIPGPCPSPAPIMPPSAPPTGLPSTTRPSLFPTDLPSVLNVTLGGLVANLTRNLTSNSSGFLENVTTPLLNLTANLTNTESVPLGLPAGDTENSWETSPYFIGPVVAVGVAIISVATTYKIGKWWWGKKSQEDKEREIGMHSFSHQREEEPSLFTPRASHTEGSVSHSSSEVNGLPHYITHPGVYNKDPVWPADSPFDQSVSRSASDQRSRANETEMATGMRSSRSVDSDLPRMPLPARPPLHGGPLTPYFEEQ